jgi:hypothetical protein
MNRIYKFPLSHDAMQIVTLPDQAKVLHVGMQADRMQLWAEVDTDPNVPKVQRKILVIGTGWPLPNVNLRHISTVIDGPDVWHVFEEV